MSAPVTVERLIDAIERREFGLDNPGFCVKCGEEIGGVEPDAEGYNCDECGAEGSVFGAEMLLLRAVPL